METVYVNDCRKSRKRRDVRVKTGDTLLGNDLLDGIQTTLFHSTRIVLVALLVGDIRSVTLIEM